MITLNDNIDFNEIDAKQFEQLCYELLLELGFKDLVWRGGPNDQGRDIDRKININYLLIGDIYENWHFECKKYDGVLTQNVFSDKISWADANRPDRLIFFTSSHLSNQTRLWFEKILPTKPYKINVIEGIELKKILFGFPNLVKKYFSKGTYGLLLEHMRIWLVHNDLPATGTINMFLKNLDLKLLSNEELIFLLASSLVVQNRVFDDDMGVQDFNFDSIIRELKKRISGKTKKIISDETQIFVMDNFNGSFCANKKDYDFSISEIIYELKNDIRFAYHCIIGEEGRWWEYLDDEDIVDKGFEFILFADSNFSTKMRIISKQSYKYYKTIQKRMNRNRLLKR